jgi:hypothetical protein
LCKHHLSVTCILSPLGKKTSEDVLGCPKWLLTEAYGIPEERRPF